MDGPVEPPDVSLESLEAEDLSITVAKFLGKENLGNFLVIASNRDDFTCCEDGWTLGRAIRECLKERALGFNYVRSMNVLK
jgi:hypothetical protein